MGACLHHHRRQRDVTLNLQGLNVSERSDTVAEGVSLYPVHQNLEVVIVTEDSQHERLPPVEGHPSSTLFAAPVWSLLGVPHHSVLIEPWVVMQSDARAVAEIQVEPVSTGVNISLDRDSLASFESTTNGSSIR